MTQKLCQNAVSKKFKNAMLSQNFYLLNIRYLLSQLMYFVFFIFPVKFRWFLIFSQKMKKNEWKKKQMFLLNFIYFERHRRILSRVVKSNLKNNLPQNTVKLGILLLPHLKGFFSAEDKVKANKLFIFSWFLSSFRKQINTLYVWNYLVRLSKLKLDTCKYLLEY